MNPAVIAVDEYQEDDQIVRLDDAPVKDLERAVLTAAIDLKAVRLLVWGFHIDRDGTDFTSPECRALWKFLSNYSPGHHLVASREEIRRHFPGFRFVKTPFPLLALAGRLFKEPRSFEPRVVGRQPLFPAQRSGRRR